MLEDSRVALSFGDKFGDTCLVKLALSVTLLAVALMGCKKAPDLAGRWNMQMGVTSMQVEFGAGTYSGTMSSLGQTGQVSGAYHTEGNILVMDPPTVVGAAGSATPSGGVMRVRMVPVSPDLINLETGKQTFTLTRIGPAK